jgi:hypothetical protein
MCVVCAGSFGTPADMFVSCVYVTVSMCVYFMFCALCVLRACICVHLRVHTCPATCKHACSSCHQIKAKGWSRTQVLSGGSMRFLQKQRKKRRVEQTRLFDKEEDKE